MFLYQKNTNINIESPQYDNYDVVVLASYYHQPDRTISSLLSPYADIVVYTKNEYDFPILSVSDTTVWKWRLVSAMLNCEKILVKHIPNFNIETSSDINSILSANIELCLQSNRVLDIFKFIDIYEENKVFNFIGINPVSNQLLSELNISNVDYADDTIMMPSDGFIFDLQFKFHPDIKYISNIHPQIFQYFQQLHPVAKIKYIITNGWIKND